jgi:hypothetical protein
MSVATTKQSTN